MASIQEPSFLHDPMPGTQIQYRQVPKGQNSVHENIYNFSQGGVVPKPAPESEEDRLREAAIKELDENHLILIAKMQEAVGKGLADRLNNSSKISAEELCQLTQAYHAICNNLPSSFLF